MVTSGGALVVSSKEGGKTKNRRGEGDLLRPLHEKELHDRPQIPQEKFANSERGDLSPIRRNRHNARMSTKHAIR